MGLQKADLGRLGLGTGQRACRARQPQCGGSRKGRGSLARLARRHHGLGLGTAQPGVWPPACRCLAVQGRVRRTQAPCFSYPTGLRSACIEGGVVWIGAVGSSQGLDSRLCAQALSACFGQEYQLDLSLYGGTVWLLHSAARAGRVLSRLRVGLARHGCLVPWLCGLGPWT